MGHKIFFEIDEEIADLIQTTLPKNVTMPVASKVLLMGWACSNLNDKKIFEAIGRMQFRKTLKDAIRYLQSKNIDLRIKAIQDFINEQGQKAKIKN